MADTSIKGNKTHKGHAQRQEKIDEVLRLRKAGLSVRDIGKETGISKSVVHKMLVEGIEQLHQVALKSAKDYVEVELARLDELHRAIWDKAIGAAGSTEKIQLNAVERLLSIQASRAKLLGLNAPIKADLDIEAKQAVELKTSEILARAIGLGEE